MVHSECAQACRDSVCMLDLNKLESIPSKVTVIGNGAFQKCTLLQRLVLREALERIGVGSFSECGDLTTVGGPSTVTKIDNGAFQRCSGLERLGLNEGLERIGECSFSECESLTAVGIPSTVAKIEKVRSNIARACTGSGCEMGLKKSVNDLSRDDFFDGSCHSSFCQADWKCCISIVRKVGESRSEGRTCEYWRICFPGMQIFDRSG
eukprot:scaffold7509_cov82-Cylindrotheca_fusiformis.AAC.1